MENLTLKVYVSRDLAIQAGRSQYGESEYRVTDADLAALTAEERKELADLPYRPLHLSSVEVTSETVLTAIRTTIAERKVERAQQAKRDAERKQEEHARWEKQIADLLAQSNEDWIRRVSGGRYELSVEYRYHSDPRIAARIERIRPLIAEKKRQYEIEEKAREEKEAAQKAATVAEFRAYALEVDSLARAAKDGYDVSGAVIDHIVEQITSLPCSGFLVLRDGTRAFRDSEWQERTSPSPEAFTVLDRVTAHVTKIRHPACVKLEVSRIMRFVSGESPDFDADKEIYTAVLVFVESPLTKTRAVVIRAEQ